MTGNAEAYLAALARCWPPHPALPNPPERRFDLPTRIYSITHWRNRIRYGIAIMSGTTISPPHDRFGLAVADPEGVKNMHIATKRSAITFAYEVNTSASKMSPNLPSAV